MLGNSHKTVQEALEDLFVEEVKISILIPGNWVAIAWGRLDHPRWSLHHRHHVQSQTTLELPFIKTLGQTTSKPKSNTSDRVCGQKNWGGLPTLGFYTTHPPYGDLQPLPHTRRR